MKTNKLHYSTSQTLTELEIRVALELLDADQRDHLRNNSLSLTEFLDNLTGIKLDNSEMLSRPAVVQTAFFLTAGGKEQ